MITSAILSNSVAANNGGPNESQTSFGCGRLLLDHTSRVGRALKGFRVFGFGWLRSWIAYSISPVITRLVPGRIGHFNGFNARLADCDLYTFANVFADYPIDDLARALPEVELIVDLGANVGAFSFLMRALCRKIGCNPQSSHSSRMQQTPLSFVGNLLPKHWKFTKLQSAARTEQLGSSPGRTP